MATKGIVLAANVGTTADTVAVYWGGGRATLITVATTYPTTCQLQVQGPDASGTFVNIGSNVTANGVQALDCPAGMYRLHLVTGTTAGLYANLVSVPYIG